MTLEIHRYLRHQQTGLIEFAETSKPVAILEVLLKTLGAVRDGKYWSDKGAYISVHSSSSNKWHGLRSL